MEYEVGVILAYIPAYLRRGTWIGFGLHGVLGLEERQTSFARSNHHMDYRVGVNLKYPTCHPIIMDSHVAVLTLLYRNTKKSNIHTYLLSTCLASKLNYEHQPCPEYI